MLCLVLLHIFSLLKFLLCSFRVWWVSLWSLPWTFHCIDSLSPFCLIVLLSLCLIPLFRTCFELWCWRRLLRVPWSARTSNQSILKEISPGCSLEGLMLKLQYFGHLIQKQTHLKRPWWWERLKVGGEVGEGGEGREDVMVGWHHRLDGHEFE